MDDIDILLSMVENPTRRRILESLVREPSYPLRLSKELGVSQQAIMKNLTLMEQNGLVVSSRMDSTMGPMRIVYTPKTEFTLVVEMHDSMFSAKVLGSTEAPDDDGAALDTEAASARIEEIDRRIEEIDKERSSLIGERNRLASTIRDSARTGIEGMTMEREV